MLLPRLNPHIVSRSRLDASGLSMDTFGPDDVTRGMAVYSESGVIGRLVGWDLDSKRIVVAWQQQHYEPLCTALDARYQRERDIAVRSEKVFVQGRYFGAFLVAIAMAVVVAKLWGLFALLLVMMLLIAGLVLSLHIDKGPLGGLIFVYAEADLARAGGSADPVGPAGG